MLFAKYILLIFFTYCFYFGKMNILKRNVSDIYDFVVQLGNNSDRIHEYVEKIQAIFCPEQPICTDSGIEDSNTVLKALPDTLTVNDETLRVQDIKDFIGLCCLPCSCSETCEEDDVCCPTRYNRNYPPNHKPAKRECVAATVRSYKRIDSLGFGLSSYFMITKCFEDKSNDSIVSKCESPDIYNIEETVPVTSVRTGRTYWNKHCAICNGDTNNLFQWTTNILLGKDVLFYFDATTRMGFKSQPNSLEELHAEFAISGRIFYTAPVSVEHDRCITKQHSRTCKDETQTENKIEISVLQEACERSNNPVYFGAVKKYVYLNIFCFLLCIPRITQIARLDKCSFIDVERGQTEMTAILDYKAASKTLLSDAYHPNHLRQVRDTCPCDQIYDYYKMMCRPLLCPVSELLVGCKCMQPLKRLSGMSVYLKLKVTTKSGNIFSPADQQISKLHTALKKVLLKTISNITAEVVATFRQEKVARSYYLCIVVVRTKKDLDTKETLKPLLPFLDTSRSLEFSRIKNKFVVYFLTRILLRVSQNLNPELGTIKLEVEDLNEEVNNLTLIYSNVEFMKSMKAEAIQVLSPLVYCKQVQLDEDEFIQERGKIIITSNMKNVWDFYLVAAAQVRICADQYLAEKAASVMTVAFESSTLIVLSLVFLYLFE